MACIFLLAGSGIGTAGSNGKKFKDVLETPSKITELSSKRILNDIAKAGNRIVSVGIRGHIVYSDDKGKSWRQAKVPVSCDLTAVHFPTSLIGWAVGNDGVVLHTTDGGATWEKQLDGFGVSKILQEHYVTNPSTASQNAGPDETFLSHIQTLIEDGPSSPFLDVLFENEKSGYIVGAFNLIFRTEDGGKSWQPLLDRTENPDGMHLYSITNTGKNIFLSGEQGLLLKLDEQTKRFQSVRTPYAGTYFGVIGRNDTVVAFGMRGNIYRSPDSGASWQKIDNKDAAGILGGEVTEGGTFLLVTQSGKILVSKDDGVSFLEQPNGGIPLHAVVSTGDGILVFASWLGIMQGKLN